MMLVAGIAALYDIRTWKIPNWLILLGLETGIFITVWQNGVRTGSIRVLAGIWIPIGILYVMFLAGWLGAGDIKLFSAVGAFYDLEDRAVCIYCRWNVVIVLCDKFAHPQKETAWFGWQGRETQDSFFSGYLAGVSGVCSIWIKEVAV